MSNTMTPAQLAEQAGAYIGHQLLNDLLGTKSQAAAVRLIADAVNDINHPAAAAGFAVIVVDVVMTGLRHLPREVPR